MTLGTIQFRNGNIFEIYDYPGKSKLQSICAARRNTKAMAGALQPIIKPNIVYAYDEVFVEFKLDDQPYDTYEIPVSEIGKYPPLKTYNNVPSYLAAMVVKYEIMHLQNKYYQERERKSRQYVLENGLYCFKCDKPLKCKDGYVYTCRHNHYTGLSKAFISRMEMTNEYIIN